jgi:hypothetical protein
MSGHVNYEVCLVNQEELFPFKMQVLLLIFFGALKVSVKFQLMFYKKKSKDCHFDIMKWME